MEHNSPGGKSRWALILIISVLFLLSDLAVANHDNKEKTKEQPAVSKPFPDHIFETKDTLLSNPKRIHSISLEARPEYIFPTNSFLRGENSKYTPIEMAYSAHLKYAFQSAPYSYADILYGGAYQGIGASYFSFSSKEEIGNPLALYFFQGARINRFNPRLSLNYEWNFGLSFMWKPYDSYENSYNKMMGSKLNAYININFYLKWMLSQHWDLIAGASLNHFSNGNTKVPNAGLNTVGLKFGLAYYMNRPKLYKPLHNLNIPTFPKHISYDLVLFGSWRRKGVEFNGEQIPSSDAYTVFGFNFAPMYNLGYKVRVGLSLDGVYDGSANVYTEDYIVGTEQEFFKPSLKRQLSLGLSARGEYVMPHFTVGLGLGVNVLHGGGDLKQLYQVFALKIELSRNSFLHIGYNLQDFHLPNYLMLGIGFRFNNKYPVCYR